MDRSGETLTNVGFVLGIIGTLFSTVAVLAAGVLVAISGLTYSKYLAEAKDDLVKLQLQTLTTAVQAYQVRNDKFPATLDELTKPQEGRPPDLDTKDLLDPWGRPYKYDLSGTRNRGKYPDIWTEGPKGDGTGQIGNWMLGK
jgi:hypothetical protein